MQFSEAFDVSRALRHGYTALKLAPLPLWIGAFLMGLTEGGGGGGGNFGDLGKLLDKGGDETYDWDGGGSDWNYRLGQLGGSLTQRVFDLRAGLEEGTFLRGQSFDDPAVIALVLGGLFCVTILFVGMFALRCWVQPGYLRLHSQVIETGAGDFGKLFGGADLFTRIAVWKLLHGAISIGAFLVASLPGIGLIVAGVTGDQQGLTIGGGVLILLALIPVWIVVSLGLYLGNHVVVFEGLGAMEALERSWSLASGNRLQLFIYTFVSGLVMLGAVFVGILMCCVGVLVTVPAARAVIDVGLTESFLLATRKDEETATWRLPTLVT